MTVRRCKRRNEPDAAAFTVADWYRQRLSAPQTPGWIPTFDEYNRDAAGRA